MLIPGGEESAGGLWRGIDPRLRILAVAVFALVVVALRDPSLLVLTVLIALLAILGAWAPLWPTLRRAAAMDGFIVLMLMMLPFTVPGEPLLTLGSWTASREGIWQAVAIALKANAIVLFLLALIGTMSAPALGQALHRLGAPAAFVQLLFFTVRYLEVLGREYRRMRLAMRARAFRPRSDLHTWRSLGYLIGMVLVRSLERSERVLAAMKCRGFDGRLHRMPATTLGTADLSFMAGFVLVQAALVWLQYG